MTGSVDAGVPVKAKFRPCRSRDGEDIGATEFWDVAEIGDRQIHLRHEIVVSGHTLQCLPRCLDVPLDVPVFLLQTVSSN